MSLTSGFFLIGLLPWFIILYKHCKKHTFLRKLLLMLSNIVFYIWGGAGAFFFLCLYSLVVFFLVIQILQRQQKWRLFISLVLALLPLAAFKYSIFFISFINHHLNEELSNSIVVPMGISFITFEAVSLIIDTYYTKISNVPNLLDIFLFLSFFPTVTSGPIIRYNAFLDKLENQNTNIDYAHCLERIIIGLSKKVLIADKVAILSDYYFDGVANGNTFSSLGLFIGSIAYSIQLYFDFSGYSDMAIGIGSLLGFKICENFNKPYLSKSVSEFWKRWHISLTQWFRDYVYIPLGGNRCNIPHHLFNMLIVWLLTGIWHGANTTFIIWGLSYFALMSFEKYVPFSQKITTGFGGHIYTLFFVNMLWIPFRSSSVSSAIRFIKGMISFNSIAIEEKAIRFLPLIISIIVFSYFWSIIAQRISKTEYFLFIKRVLIVLLALAAICASINTTYSPYIYGNF